MQIAEFTYLVSELATKLRNMSQAGPHFIPGPPVLLLRGQSIQEEGCTERLSCFCGRMSSHPFREMTETIACHRTSHAAPATAGRQQGQTDGIAAAPRSTGDAWSLGSPLLAGGHHWAQDIHCQFSSSQPILQLKHPAEITLLPESNTASWLH